MGTFPFLLHCVKDPEDARGNAFVALLPAAKQLGEGEAKLPYGLSGARRRRQMRVDDGTGNGKDGELLHMTSTNK